MSNVCEHGRLRRKCADCDITEAEKRIADLEAALEKIMECSGDPETYQIAKKALGALPNSAQSEQMNDV